MRVKLWKMIFRMMKMNKVYCLVGDVRETLSKVADESVNCCITSPPYFNLRTYTGSEKEIGNEQTPEEYINGLVDIFDEIKRVLRKDGVCFVNIGDTYAGKRMGDIKRKEVIGIPYMFAFEMRRRGWYWRDSIIWAKAISGENQFGRCQPESVKDRTTRAHENILMFTKSTEYYYDWESIAEPWAESTYNRVLSSNNLDKRKDVNQQHVAISSKNQSNYYDTIRDDIKSGERKVRVRRNVWNYVTASSAVKHFAIYPPSLIEPLILSGCPEDGMVLDPFGGTGTTAILAKLLGRNAIHCELNPETYEFMKLRAKEIARFYSVRGREIVNGRLQKRK